MKCRGSREMKEQILKVATEYAKVIKVDGMTKDENQLAMALGFYMTGVECVLEGEGHDDNFIKDTLDKIFKITINEIIDEYTLKEEMLQSWKEALAECNV